jgi:signal transduction histidine kinase
MILQKIEHILTRSTNFFRLMIITALVVLVGVESAEFELGIADVFHWGEVIIYFVLLGGIWILAEVVLRAHKKQQSSLKLLQYKHQMSLELLPYQNWNSLVQLLVKQVAELVDARAASLFQNTSSTNDFELVAEWKEAAFDVPWDFDQDCIRCLSDSAFRVPEPHLCDFKDGEDVGSEAPVYCYPILFKNERFALFRFLLKPGRVISAEQKEILISIRDEIVISLIAGQDRKKLSELELAETALAERHTISHFLHDNLGQNLGYLRMKLDQFVNQPEILGQSDDTRAELKRMKDVADEAYQLVRNKLEVTIPDSTPLLVNFLQEHAKKVSERSKIEIRFTNRGLTKAVPVELQRAVFFVFQEALANVEKHAGASIVEVSLDWQSDSLRMSVTDNGTGFDVERVSTHKHFGLEIIRERVMGVGGTAEIRSAENMGTTIHLFMPLPVGKKGKSGHG